MQKYDYFQPTHTDGEDGCKIDPLLVGAGRERWREHMVKYALLNPMVGTYWNEMEKVPYTKYLLKVSDECT